MVSSAPAIALTVSGVISGILPRSRATGLPFDAGSWPRIRCASIVC